MKLVLVVAMARNRVIGRDNALPWHLPEDLRHFKQATMGKPMIMGRKTWDSIGRPLPGRTSIVVSRSGALTAVEGMVPVTTLDQALAEAGALVDGDGECAVVGGAEIYRQTLPLADAIELTLIEQDVEGDTEFPPFDKTEWREVSSESHAAAHDPSLRFSFLRYERQPS